LSLLTLIITLLLEHFYPLSARKYLSVWLTGYAQFFEHHFNPGQHKQGGIAWLLAVLPLLAVVMVIFWLLSRVHPIVALAFNVLVLYLAMGFRQYSQYCTDIQQALSEGDLDKARGLLSQWRGVPSHEFNAEEVARVSIEQAIIATQRNVFGVIVWFVLSGRCCIDSDIFCARAGGARMKAKLAHWASSHGERTTCWNGCRFG
jgi:adenosylcobinamide-phosphate synthase